MWEEMKTAPRDREILAYCKDTEEYHVVMWMKCIDSDEEIWSIARVRDCYDDGCHRQVTIIAKPDVWAEIPRYEEVS